MIGRTGMLLEAGYTRDEPPKSSNVEFTRGKEMTASGFFNDMDDTTTTNSILKSNTKEFPQENKETTRIKLAFDEHHESHPLDVIEKELRQISDLDYPSLESKFVLSNFQLRDHKKISNIDYSRLETINHHLFQMYSCSPKSITVIIIIVAELTLITFHCHLLDRSWEDYRRWSPSR